MKKEKIKLNKKKKNSSILFKMPYSYFDITKYYDYFAVLLCRILYLVIGEEQLSLFTTSLRISFHPLKHNVLKY